MDLTSLTDNIIGTAIEVHRALGPGLLESTYEMCLCHELALRDLAFERQRSIAVSYKGVKLDCGYRADLIVEGSVLVEIKAVEDLTPLNDAQLLSYLKLGGWNVGLMLNFNVLLLKHGIRRKVLNLRDDICFSLSHSAISASSAVKLQ